MGVLYTPKVKGVLYIERFNGSTYIEYGVLFYYPKSSVHA